MTKLYQKDPLFFALACICVYVCTFSASEGVSARLGAPYLFTVPAGVVLCLVLGGWIRRQGLTKFLGLCRFRGTAGQYLCFLPLMVPAGCNLWHGVQWNFPPLDTFIYILSMLLAGFLEEVLFRGLVFGNLKEKSRILAYVVSCVLFAFMHVWTFALSAWDWSYFILMLQYLVPGLVFAWAFDQSGTLWTSILLHATVNALALWAIVG